MKELMTCAHGALHGRQAQGYLLIIIVARKTHFSRIREPVKDSDRQAESNQRRGFTLQVYSSAVYIVIIIIISSTERRFIQLHASSCLLTVTVALYLLLLSSRCIERLVV
jgi:hypothetical protein